MISTGDLYSVLSAVVPLYVTMFLAYGSVKWWHIFSPEQCAGINRFVAFFAVPLLSFEFISQINPYKMNLLFLAADGVSKVLVLALLFSWVRFSKRGSLDWAITMFSVSTLPNTLVMGIPLLKSMYGDDKELIMIQVVVLQCIIWYTLLLFLFEYREARIIILDKLKKGSGSNSGRSEDSVGGVQKRIARSLDNEDEALNVSLNSPPSHPQSLQGDNKPASDARRLRIPVVAAAAEGGKEHLFIRRCGCCSSQGACEQSVQVCGRLDDDENKARETGGEDDHQKQMHHEQPNIPPPASMEMFTQILKMVRIKLMRNPNSYSSILGFGWALASCKWGIKKPQIMDNSVTILSNAGLGMAMFSLGLFMALQPKVIACGKKLAAYGMIARFVAGPAVMAVASIGVGIRGTLLRVAIVQAALPQGIVPFVFAREYNLHPDMLSTAVIFGMIVSLPITVLYYILLGL